jgi:peptidoglycan/LPS O-acetylase OafA/YrhL
MAPVGLLSRFFRSQWLRGLGTISYCVYLIHQPIWYLVFRSAGYPAPVIRNLSGGLLTVITVVLTLYIARLSWKYLESPLIQRAHRLYKY